MTQEAKEEVERYLRSGERDLGIEYLRNNFNISAQDATMLVEALEREIGVMPPATSPTAVEPSAPLMDHRLRTEVTQMLQAGRKMDAVKHVRKSLYLGLKEALVLVEQVAGETIPNYNSVNATGCLRVVLKGVGVFFLAIAIMFFAAAAIVYFIQSRSIGNSDRVAGVVTGMRSNETGGTAPVVEYEWQGNKRSYESTLYSTPPDYEEGQQIFLFVNRDDPSDATIDSFTDRWALIVGLAVIGGFLLLISIVFLYFGRRKF